MTAVGAAGPDTIGVLRVRAPGARRITARAAIERRLATLDVRPSSLGPSAVLVVRRLVAASPGPAGPRDLEARVRSALDDLARRAARPEDAAAEEADAVVFVDAGHLLACLAAALARGVSRWWMHLLLGTPPPALAGLLVEQARLLPAALAHLPAAEATRVVAALGPRHAAAVLRALADAHGIDLAPNAREASRPASTAPAGPGDPAGRSSPSPGAGAPSDFHATGAVPPWLPWLGDAGVRALAPPAQALLGLARALHEAPVRARSRAFGEQARRWWSSRGDPSAAPPTAPVEPITAAPGPPATVAPARSRPGADAGRSRLASPAPAGRGRARRPRPARLALRAAAGAGRVVPARAARSTPTGAAAHPSADAVETRLAGVVYLLNAMRALDLPAAFEEDWGLASMVGAWGVLEALARALLHPRSDDVADDPLWGVLATLGGRDEGVPPGVGLVAAPFRAPLGWRPGVDPAPAGERGRGPEGEPAALDWAASATRLRLWIPPAPASAESARAAEREIARAPVEDDRAPAIGRAAPGHRHSPAPARTGGAGAHRGGLPMTARVIADVPRDGRPIEHAAREARRWCGDAPVALRRRRLRRAPAAGISGIHVAALAAPLRRWLGLVLPFVRQRLLAALGPGQIDLERDVLRRGGRLHVTASHVDVVMPLGAVSVAVRHAGLDADPGWRPELGRVVAFHYE